jgi:hypothetical protein
MTAPNLEGRLDQKFDNMLLRDIIKYNLTKCEKNF